MKEKFKIFGLVFAICLTFCFTGCGDVTSSVNTSDNSINDSSDESIDSNASAESSLDESSGEASSNTASIPDKQLPSHTVGEYVSNTYIATGNNMIINEAENVTYRAYFPLEQYGELEYCFTFSNTVDSTYSNGKKAYVGRPGGNYTISNCVIADGGTSPDDEITNRVDVTFDGKAEKAVTPDEVYSSDPVSINIPKGHYLVWEWTISGTDIPCIAMSTLTSTTSSADGNEFAYCDYIPLPQIIGAKRDVKHTVCAIGDSITQGCQTEFMKYEFWAAQYAVKLGEDVSFYNAGLGWSRASDAAQCLNWLERAKGYETVLVAFGTNDIGAGNYGGEKNSADEIIGYLTAIIDELEKAGCKVVLFTSPPQDYKETNESVRTELNRLIPELCKEKSIQCFDFAGILSDDSQPGVAIYGGHPNGEGGTIVSDKLTEQISLE